NAVLHAYPSLLLPLPLFYLFFFQPIRQQPSSTLFPYTTLFRSKTRVNTAKSRAALPQDIPHADAAYSVGRATLLGAALAGGDARSEEHTSELQSLAYLVCRLLLEKKKK